MNVDQLLVSDSSTFLLKQKRSTFEIGKNLEVTNTLTTAGTRSCSIHPPTHSSIPPVPKHPPTQSSCDFTHSPLTHFVSLSHTHSLSLPQTDLMSHPLHTITYVADIDSVLVIMAHVQPTLIPPPTVHPNSDDPDPNSLPDGQEREITDSATTNSGYIPKLTCHVLDAANVSGVDVCSVEHPRKLEFLCVFLRIMLGFCHDRTFQCNKNCMHHIPMLI